MANGADPFLPAWTGSPGMSEKGMSKGGFLPPWVSGSRSGQARGEPRPMIIRGGECVFPRMGIFTLDIMSAHGRIAAVGRDLPVEGCDIVDAAGKYVIPGVVDPHVHLGIFGAFGEELDSETRSALSNGVTTIGLYAGGKDPYLETLERTIGLIEERSHADIFIHLPIFTHRQLQEIPIYAARYGITSFKAYMCGIPGLIPAVDDAFLFDIMEAVAALGPGAILCIHAENEELVNRAALKGLTRDPLRRHSKAWAAARPSYVEEEAITRAEFLARTTGVRIYFVHLSSSAGTAAVRLMKKNGSDILAETTSPYLTMEPDETSDARAVMVPPLRGGEDRKALWQGLMDGTIDTIGTDHTPLSSEQKHLQSRANDVVPGYPAVGTHLPAMLDGARRNGMSMEMLTDRLCTRPAEIFGIYPRKGSLTPGSDADIVVVDPLREDRVTVERAASRSDFALLEGRRLIGWPSLVIKGGMPMSPDSDIAEFRGAYLPRRIKTRSNS